MAGGLFLAPRYASNRASAWVSGGSNYVYETNKSEREAETEATQDTPFSPVKKSFSSSVSTIVALRWSLALLGLTKIAKTPMGFRRFPQAMASCCPTRHS